MQNQLRLGHLVGADGYIPHAILLRIAREIMELRIGMMILIFP